ncbi:uncharacterized protein PV06_11039 [Exophiala oligosperma]|uniref:Uncharacterized protein n=1 Tax=Exophiala oligosperma TaxID=215243 RepID=A0A0D2D0D1_9EURO|nr:uncharacterized protein PV06_11039 [Exophiala oligosperma]KIW36743.1 hypothetical protein PV06_11039 [Exophiala oligosperma]
MEVDIPGDPAFRLLAAVYASLGPDAVGLTVATTSSAEPFKFKVRSAHTAKRFDPEASPHDIDLLPGTRHLKTHTTVPYAYGNSKGAETLREHASRSEIHLVNLNDLPKSPEGLQLLAGQLR